LRGEDEGGGEFTPLTLTLSLRGERGTRGKRIKLSLFLPIMGGIDLAFNFLPLRAGLTLISFPPH